MLTLVALVAGRLLSIGRAALIDPTFRVAVPGVDCHRAPHWGSIRPVQPDYRQLTDNGRREAFKLAVSNEQRPYQFGGNTAVAVIIAVISWIVSERRAGGRLRTMILVALTSLIVIFSLYGGARVSHYRYAQALAALNGQEFRSFSASGAPCQSGGITAALQTTPASRRPPSVRRSTARVGHSGAQVRRGRKPRSPHFPFSTLPERASSTIHCVAVSTKR